MNKEEFIKTITSLTKMYNKELDIEQTNIWYSFFKETKETIFKLAVRNIIGKSKFMPTVADLREEVEKIEEEKKQYIFNATIEKMKQDGYFATPTEYEKIMNWYSNGIIPCWFKEDMKKYEPELLGHKEILQIGE